MSDDRDTSARRWSLEARQVGGELARMLQLRRELATLEFQHDRRLIRRFLLAGGVAAWLILSGCPLWLTAVALALSQVTTLSAVAWLSLGGVVLVLPGALLLVLATRQLRREFRGLHDTLAELREDLEWVREWVERDRAPSAEDQVDRDS
jgi:cobalamin biosynthesis protein CobD/CbiB